MRVVVRGKGDEGEGQSFSDCSGMIFWALFGDCRIDLNKSGMTLLWASDMHKSAMGSCPDASRSSVGEGVRE